MEKLKELKAKFYDLVIIKDKHFLEVDRLAKEIQAIVDEIKKIEALENGQ